MVRDLIVFGATGDLTSRYLMPALAELDQGGQLPRDLSVLGIAQQRWDDDRFRRHIAERLERHAAHAGRASRDRIVSALSYAEADVTSAMAVRRALGAMNEAVVAYLALPPALAPQAVAALSDALSPGSRVVLEKPFGTDLRSAQHLNELLHRSFPEESVFRVDHFLQKQTVQNILGLRFANRVFESLWNRDHVERVDIIWDETLALEGRAAYYDSAGALRDMIQNHLLQLLCLAAMEAPVSMGARDLRDRKVDVLRAVRVGLGAVCARYSAGSVGGRDVPAYADEPGVDPRRGTETFAEITLTIENWRWAGVPFRLRTGKAMAVDRKEIALHFRPVPHLAFEESCPAANVLRLRFAPDGVALSMNVTGRGEQFDLECVELEARQPRQELSAYARVLLAVLRGDASLSIRGDEAEEAWRIVEPILDAWRSGGAPPGEYPAGSQGPTE